MKSYLRVALTGLLMLAFISPVLAAKQTQPPQQPTQPTPYRGASRR